MTGLRVTFDGAVDLPEPFRSRALAAEVELTAALWERYADYDPAWSTT